MGYEAYVSIPVIRVNHFPECFEVRIVLHNYSQTVSISSKCLHIENHLRSDSLFVFVFVIGTGCS